MELVDRALEVTEGEVLVRSALERPLDALRERAVFRAIGFRRRFWHSLRVNVIRRVALLVVPLAILGSPGVASATVDVSLDVVPTNPAMPDEGGQWSLVAKTDDPDGIAAIRVSLDGVDNGSIHAGDPQDDIALEPDIGALAPIVQGGNSRPPYLAYGVTTELLYGQDLSSPPSVVTAVPTPVTTLGGLARSCP